MSSTKPAITVEPLGMKGPLAAKTTLLKKGLKHRDGPHVLPAPAALHATITPTGSPLNVTTGFSAMPSPSRVPRVTLGVDSVACRITLTGTRLGASQTAYVDATGAGDFDFGVAFDTITALTTNVDPEGDLDLKTGLGWGLPDAINDAEEFAVDGVRATVDVDYLSGTVRLTSGQIPNGTKKYSITYTPRYE